MRSEEEIVEGVRERLREAVRIRLKADVPVAVYLSGGIDSSSVAGMVADLMRQGTKLGSEQNSVPSNMKCFTVQFDEDSGADESGIFPPITAQGNMHFLITDNSQQLLSAQRTGWASISSLLRWMKRLSYHASRTLCGTVKSPSPTSTEWVGWLWQKRYTLRESRLWLLVSDPRKRS